MLNTYNNILITFNSSSNSAAYMAYNFEIISRLKHKYQVKFNLLNGTKINKTNSLYSSYLTDEILSENAFYYPVMYITVG